MERKRMVGGEKEIRWKKIGGGGFLFKGHFIKPGQIFTARVDEIPKSFRDICIPLEDIPAAPPNPPIEVKKSEYTIQPRGKNNVWYDVVDSNGKVMNEKALTKDIATEFAQDLSK